MGSLSMLFYVVECFTVNLEKLAADAVGSLEVGRIDKQVQGDGRFIAIALSEAAHEIHEIGALYAEGAQVSDHAAELAGLVANSLLEVSQVGDSVFGVRRDLATENVQLDFNGKKGLQDAVMKVARNAAAFAFDRSGAQVPQKKEVLQGRPHMPGDTLKPG